MGRGGWWPIALIGAVAALVGALLRVGPASGAATTATYDFATDSEGWVATPGANSTLVWQSADGSPAAGSLEAQITGGSRSATSVWSVNHSWTELGVPAGAVVTAVQLSTIRERTSQFTGGSGNSWSVQLRNTGGSR